MNQLIKITETEGKQIVSARDLWSFLQSKKDFSSWIKHRISKYGLIENLDYTSLPQMGEPDNQQINRIEYVLTLDSAKELAMVEGNAKGKEARLYFIECEKKLALSTKPLSQIEILQQSLTILMEQSKRIETVEEKVAMIEAKQITSPIDFFAIAGYASMNKIKVDTKFATNLGRKASKLCRELGYMTGSVPDSKYGSVKTYPTEVLDIIFSEWKKI